jgi:hypothetical protein
MNQAQNAKSSTSETASKPQIGQLEVVAEQISNNFKFYLLKLHKSPRKSIAYRAI